MERKIRPKKHTDYMSSSWIGGMSVKKNKNNLVTEWVYFVQECSFTFQFVSLDQLDECIEYFSLKVLPSTIKQGIVLEHYWQRWFERLPKGLVAKKKKEKILKALKKARIEFNNE